MSSQICVDASVVLKLLLYEADSDKAHARWASWIEQDIEPVAPCHLAFEVISDIRNHVYRRAISAEAGQVAFEAFGAQEIALVHPDRLNGRAWEIAEQYSRPTAYDAHYLALAETLGCELWTADRRLVNSVRGALPWVRWLGDFTSRSS
jgi:predicted nucleic acid-binding protein